MLPSIAVFGTIITLDWHRQSEIHAETARPCWPATKEAAACITADEQLGASAAAAEAAATAVSSLARQIRSDAAAADAELRRATAPARRPAAAALRCSDAHFAPG